MDLAPLLAWMLVAVRAAALMAVFPGLQGALLPVPVRMALALALAAVVQPMVPATDLPGGWGPLVLAVVGETLLGLLMGFTGRLVFFAVEGVARVITQEIGLSATPGVDGPAGSADGLAGALQRLAVVLFFVVGGHLAMVAAFSRSFAGAPPGHVALAATAPAQLAAGTGLVIAWAVQLAAPFLALNFLITLGFGLLGRAVPRMNVFVLSFAVRSLAGIALLGFAAVVLGRMLLQVIDGTPFRVLELLSRP